MTLRPLPSSLALALGLSAAPLAACDNSQSFVEPEPHLERMLDQRRADPYEAHPFFANDMAMQRPPSGTVPYDDVARPHDVDDGIAGGQYVPKFPVHVDRAMVESGQRDYRIFCSPCHGIAGEGNGPVAMNMRLRKPPSLVDDPVRAYPVGRIYATIKTGYGLMPSYAQVLSVDQRWGVAAYVEALQIAHRSNVADLPPELRAELAKEAP